jgi:glycosyltransferase involved in cell wall biosynthesis
VTDAPKIAVAYDCLYPYTTGGGERLYSSIARILADRGCSVDYLTSKQWDAADPPHEPYQVVPVSGVLRLYNATGVRRTSAAFAFAWALFRRLLTRRQQYDALIVSGLPVLNVFAARLGLLGSGTRLIVDYLEVWKRAQWVEYAGIVTGNAAWLLQRLAIAVTPMATCHSQLTARRLRADGFRRHLLISPGLIDSAATFEASPAGNPPFVLYVGRHIPDKRVEVIPQAVAFARQTIPDLRLVILGQGPSTPLVDAAVQAVSGADWTDRPGFVSQRRLDELMASASVLVNPSRREGYGLVVVEASAHGTPVVLAMDEGNAATELVEGGVNGFVSPSPQPAALGEAIVAAVEGGSELRARARCWYDEAVRTKTIERTVDGIVAALELSNAMAVTTKGTRNVPPTKDHREYL